MRILITGGFGFVGARLAVHLAQAGHQITIGSRNSVSSPEWLPQAEVSRTDWNDGVALEHICDGVDVVIHAAGMNAQDCAADPVAALAFNGLATARLIAAASRAAVRKIIYFSTAHVYASPLLGTITEDTCPCNLHPYGTSHLAGENAVLGAAERGEIQCVVLRLSNAFGAPMHKDVNCWMLLVNDLCKQAVQTRELILRSNGLQHRDFIGLTDVCRVIEKLTFSQASTTNKIIFNLGSGVSQSVRTMAELIQQRCSRVLGFEPIMKNVKGGLNEYQPTLTFKSNNLEVLGNNLNYPDNTSEIDNLLKYCYKTFV